MNSISARNKGLMTGALMVALSMFFYYGLKKPFESNFQYFIYTVYSAGIIWALLDLKKTAAADATFKSYFAEGFKMFVAATLIMVVFVFIFYYLNPQIRDAKFAENTKLLLQEGNHTPDEIAKNTEQMKRVFIPMMLGITTFMYLFLGALITAVTAGFISQKK